MPVLDRFPELRPPVASVQPRLVTGGEAVAHAMRQIDPDVVPVYPITPQTPIIQTFSSMVSDGQASTTIVNVESEHSAMSTAIGSALAGARTITVTSSQGLALMADLVYIAASMRAPIVMAVGDRALSEPISIHRDHSDSMLVRDAGVLQLFAENAQEAYDLMVMAPRVAEHPGVSLPVLVCQDGFTITHPSAPVKFLSDELVRAFVGDYRLDQSLRDVAHPTTQGPFAMPDYYYEQRRAQIAALLFAEHVLAEVATEFTQLTGRCLSALEPYAINGADRVIVALASSAGTIKDVVDELRDEGERVGVLKIRWFRPFPATALRHLLRNVAEVIVLDRSGSPGGAPPLCADVAFALGGSGARVSSHVDGLGGRDLHPEAVREVFAGAVPAYLGVRG